MHADGRNNPWLDLVRCLAIGLVLLRHGQRALSAGAQAGDAQPVQGVFETIAINGWIGVDLFFVLSGYLIGRHLLRAGLGTASFNWGRYVALRALRIVPAYYAVLLLTAAGVFPLFPVEGRDMAFRLAYHLLFLQDYLPSDINVVFWSLGVEEKFYLLAPLLVLALLRLPGFGLRAMALLVLFALPGLARIAAFTMGEGDLTYTTFWLAYRSPFHMALEGLLAGVAIAMAQQAGLVRPGRRTGLAMLAAGSLGLLAWMASHDFMATIGWADIALQPPLIALVAGAITLGGVMLAGTPLPLAWPVRQISRLSYSLYLVHFPLLPLARALVQLETGPVFWAVYLGLSLMAALLLHVGVERPFLAWKDRIAARNRHAEVPVGATKGA